MKKILLSAAALLTLLFAASCQKEDFSGADGEFATVTLTVQAPASPVTKAFGDGTTPNLRLDFGVFDENGEVLDALRQTDIEFGAADSEGKRSTTVKVNLAKGKTYHFICWAQDNTLACYNHGDLKAITVDYSKDNAANVEKRDAFYACVKSDIVTADYTQTITLTRPFAQLNVGSDDLKEAEKAGVDTTNLYVELSVTDCPNVLNADFAKQSYTVAGSVEATFTKAICPATGTDPERINVELNGTPKSYSWLSMNYIFTSVSKDDLKKVTFNLYEEGTHLVTYTEDNVPFQANWRTNLLGRLLTTDGELTVVIDPNFANVHNIYLDAISQEALKTAIDNKVAGTYNVSGYVHAVAAVGTDQEKVTLKDDKDEANPTVTRDYTLSVVGLKADDTFYQEGDYLVVSVTVDAEGEVSNAQNHVYHRPASSDDEEVVEPVTPELSLVVDSTEPVSAGGGKLKVKVTSNVAWTLSLNGSKVAEGSEAVAGQTVEVEVSANKKTEVITHTLVLSDVPAEGATAKTETVEFKQAAAEAEQNPSFAEGKYWIVSNEKYATPLSANYGYLQVTAGGYLDNVFTIMAVQGGYTIQDPDGYFYYQTGSYNNYNRAQDRPTEGAVWTIEANEDGTYTITNAATSKTIQYDNTHDSYGCYTEVTRVLPQLIPADGATVRPIFTVTPVSKSIAFDVTEVAINIESNQSWTIAPGVGVDLDVTSGENNATVTMTIPVNESEEAKEYTATVSSEGFEPVVVKVTQAGVPTGDTPVEIELTEDDLTYSAGVKGKIDGKLAYKLGTSSAAQSLTINANGYKTIVLNAAGWTTGTNKMTITNGTINETSEITLVNDSAINSTNITGTAVNVETLTGDTQTYTIKVDDPNQDIVIQIKRGVVWDFRATK